MPKWGVMAQLSRPFQIALVGVLALAMLVLAWFMVVHRPSGEASTGSSAPASRAVSSTGHSSAGAFSTARSSARASSTGRSSAGASATGRSSAQTPSPAASGHVYHGPVPGLEGLTRDIKRAHEAAAKEERGVQEPQSAAAQHPSPSSPPSSSNVASSSSVASSAGRASAGHASSPGASLADHSSHSSSSTTTAVIPQRTPHARSGSTTTDPSRSAPAMQAVVASELARGKVVLVLFWNPRSSDDRAVDEQVKAAAHTLGGHVVMHTASASQVNSFGSITRDIQVYQTPTLLIVNPRGQVTTLTGYTDAFSIEQAVAEARG
jgi:hypothetical protein